MATKIHGSRAEPAPAAVPVVARPAGSVPALAVLPLRNISGDPKQEYFADGMTEALIADLAQLGGARVISRTSSMTYKGQQKALPQIAQELGVAFVVEGSVAREGSRVMLIAQLIDARTDEHVWARTYERNARDVRKLQGQAATEISAAVKGVLTPSQQAVFAGRRPVDPAAYDLYLRGRYAWNRRTPEGFAEARAAFEEAIARESGFALAYAGLADTYGLLSGADRQTLVSSGKAAALKALELDDTLAEAHTSLAAVYHRGEGKRDEAEREFRRAIALNPGYATAHQWYAILLAEDGRDAEAMAQAQEAARLDPRSGTMRMTLGLVHYYARRFAVSVQEERQALELQELPLARHFLARTLLALGRPQDAVLLYADTPPPPMADGIAALAAAHQRTGNGAAAEALLRPLRAASPLPAGALARYHATVGERDLALAMIEKAASLDPPGLASLLADPVFDPIRGDARFTAVARGAGRAVAARS